MSGSLREILPRLQLKSQDQLPGVYPTVARTGDRGRSGVNNVFFDDSQTVVFFSASSKISFPTLLPVSSPYLMTDMTSSLTMSLGTVGKSTIEQWITINPQTESFRPFNETYLFAQDLNKTSSFFASGSHPSDVGLGFGSPLGSKTMIRITLPITTAKQMDPLTSSVYYFNSGSSKFEEAGTARKYHNAFGGVPFDDVQLFSPLGNVMVPKVSGQGSLATFNGSQTVRSALIQALTTDPTDLLIPSPLADVSFAPTASQLIDMSKYIQQPFLLEKAIVEVPLKAGSGWLSDQTQYHKIVPTWSDQTDDAGGPAIVFSLLNSFPDRRDLIFSASVIPAGDNYRGYRYDKVNDTSFGGGTINLRSLNGFLGYATPAAVVYSGSNSQFTGTVRFSALPAISNGALARKNVTNYTTVETFLDSYLINANTFGRASYPLQPSGRSYFGKEYTIPSSFPTASLVRSLYGAPASGTYDYPGAYFYENNQHSPYLLYPTDKVVFAASKYRAIGTSSAGVFSATKTHDVYLNTGTINIVLYGSLISNASEFHDTLNQRLETNEAHEMLGSEPVLDQFQTEYFQLYSGSQLSQQLSGSLLQTVSVGNYSTGSRYVWADAANTSSFSENVEIAVNGEYVNFSDLNTKKKERFSLLRYTQTFSENERFYDSMVPALEDIYVADGTRLYGVQFVYNPCTTPSPIGEPIAFFSFDVWQADATLTNNILTVGNTNVDWTKSYPFEAKYEGIRRKTTATDITFNDVYIYACTFDSLNAPPVTSIQRRLVKGWVNATSNYVWVGETYAEFSATANGIRFDTLTKMLYGFGDLNTYPNDGDRYSLKDNCGYSGGGIPSASIKMYGCTQFPKMRAHLAYDITGSMGSAVPACKRSALYRGAEIRGWKYGLVNGFSQFTKAYYNAKNYGQPRDLLEQRLDTKFYESVGYTAVGSKDGNIGPLSAPVQVKFVNQNGEQTKPEYTFSSNLSYEATSSLPYFDGNVRNREEPLQTSGLNLNVVAP